jgi:hypothetical protein
MTWNTIALLIIEIGLPAAMKIVEKWENGSPVGLQELNEVRAVAQQTAADRVKAQLVKAGIALDSDQAKALIAMAQ